MINILLAFDEEDEVIGSFNQGCQEDYREYFEDSNHGIVTYINSGSLNSLNIQLRTEQLPSFIFVAYSHGEDYRLFSKSGDYISSSINIELFRNSFFYTVSCNTGNTLGVDLISNGCKCYFGYKTLFNSWCGYKAFSECANYGFFKFIEGDSTDEIYKVMIERYNYHIDNMYVRNFLQASLLRENRDGLIKLGEDINIEDLRKAI
nr:hypothetical protein [Elizabethkingia sp. ASV34]